MAKKLKFIFLMIEINLLFWLLILGHAVMNHIEGSLRIEILIGFILAAILQHVAYYRIYKGSSDN